MKFAGKEYTDLVINTFSWELIDHRSLHSSPERKRKPICTWAGRNNHRLCSDFEVHLSVSRHCKWMSFVITQQLPPDAFDTASVSSTTLAGLASCWTKAQDHSSIYLRSDPSYFKAENMRNSWENECPSSTTAFQWCGAQKRHNSSVSHFLQSCSVGGSPAENPGGSLVSDSLSGTQCEWYHSLNSFFFFKRCLGTSFP